MLSIRRVHTTNTGRDVCYLGFPRYLNTTGCRRAHLVGHFGETYQRLPTATAALCCDNCANRAAAALASRDGQVPNEAEIEQLHQQEMAKASRLLLQAVVDTGSRFGSGVVIA